MHREHLGLDALPQFILHGNSLLLKDPKIVPSLPDLFKPWSLLAPTIDRLAGMTGLRDRLPACYGQPIVLPSVGACLWRLFWMMKVVAQHCHEYVLSHKGAAETAQSETSRRLVDQLHTYHRRLVSERSRQVRSALYSLWNEDDAAEARSIYLDLLLVGKVLEVPTEHREPNMQEIRESLENGDFDVMFAQSNEPTPQFLSKAMEYRLDMIAAYLIEEDSVEAVRQRLELDYQQTSELTEDRATWLQQLQWASTVEEFVETTNEYSPREEVGSLLFKGLPFLQNND